MRCVKIIILLIAVVIIVNAVSNVVNSVDFGSVPRAVFCCSFRFCSYFVKCRSASKSSYNASRRLSKLLAKNLTKIKYDNNPIMHPASFPYVCAIAKNKKTTKFSVKTLVFIHREGDSCLFCLFVWFLNVLVNY